MASGPGSRSGSRSSSTRAAGARCGSARRCSCRARATAAPRSGARGSTPTPTPPTRAAKRYAPIERATIGEGDELIRIDDSRHDARRGGRLGRRARVGRRVDGRARRARRRPGVAPRADARARRSSTTPTRAARVIVGGRDARARAAARSRCTCGASAACRRCTGSGRRGPATARSRSRRSRCATRFSLGLATLRLDGPDHGEPPRAARRAAPARLAAGRRHRRAPELPRHRDRRRRAPARPRARVGRAAADGRLRVSRHRRPRSDGRAERHRLGAPRGLHAHGARRAVAPGRRAPRRRRRRRRDPPARAAARTSTYIAWDATDARPRRPAPAPRPRAPTTSRGRRSTAIVALGLTYGDHVRETGRKLDAERATDVVHQARARVRARRRRRARPRRPRACSRRSTRSSPGSPRQLRERIPLLPAGDGLRGRARAGRARRRSTTRGSPPASPQPFGLAAANDLTARLCQVLGETTEQPLDVLGVREVVPARSSRSPPHVWAPPGGLAAMPELTLETRVNGELRQHASTKLLIYDLPAIVRAARAHLGRPLARGDVILTGTPGGRRAPAVAAQAPGRRAGQGSVPQGRAARVDATRPRPRCSGPATSIEVDAGPAGRVRTRLVL